MTNGFRIDTDQLRHTAPLLTGQAAELAAALGDLRTELDGLGPFLGDDLAGQTIGQRYLVVRPEIEQGLEALTQALGGAGDSLLAMADNHDASDAASRIGVSGFDLGPGVDAGGPHIGGTIVFDGADGQQGAEGAAQGGSVDGADDDVFLGPQSTEEQEAQWADQYPWFSEWDMPSPEPTHPEDNWADASSDQFP